MRNQMLVGIVVAGVLIGCSSGGAGNQPRNQPLADGTYKVTLVAENIQDDISDTVDIVNGSVTVFTGGNTHVSLKSLNTGAKCGNLAFNNVETKVTESFDFDNCTYSNGILTTGSFNLGSVSAHMIFEPKTK